MFCSFGLIGDADNSDISGIWIFEDVNKMCTFLNIKKQNTSNYCMKIDRSQLSGSIYFVTNKNIYRVGIRKISKNNYILDYNNKTRSFVVNYNSEVNNIFMHFDDSCKYPPVSKYRYCVDGYRFKTDIGDNQLKSCLDWIKNEDGLPDAPPPY